MKICIYIYIYPYRIEATQTAAENPNKYIDHSQGYVSNKFHDLSHGQ